MLTEVLSVYFNDGIFSSRYVSEKLGITKEIAEEYKMQLIRMGYIQKQEECTMESCKSCSCGCSGKKLNGVINWDITEKGYKVINNIKKRGVC